MERFWGYAFSGKRPQSSKSAAAKKAPESEKPTFDKVDRPVYGGFLFLDDMKKHHPICPICEHPLDYFETSRYGTILHATQRYLERCHFALDIGRVGRDAALEKWMAMGGEVAGDDEVDWV